MVGNCMQMQMQIQSSSSTAVTAGSFDTTWQGRKAYSEGFPPFGLALDSCIARMGAARALGWLFGRNRRKEMVGCKSTRT